MQSYIDLLTETCEYSRSVSKNAANESTYEVSQVRCFVTTPESSISRTDKIDLNYKARIFLDAAFVPSTDDLINGEPIKWVREVKGLIEPLTGYEVLV